MRNAPKRRTAFDSVFELKVTLLGTRPPIWRRFRVESTVTLERLHRILQVIMGWTDSHMHGFRVPHAALAGARRQFVSIERADEKTTTLASFLHRRKDRILYEYDFGDGWEHEITLEDIVASSPEARYPLVLSGRRACPPEDIGGIPGYAHFLEAIADPEHPDHEEMVEWYGEDFDPKRFDAQALNRAFHGGWGPKPPA